MPRTTESSSGSEWRSFGAARLCITPGAAEDLGRCPAARRDTGSGRRRRTRERLAGQNDTPLPFTRPSDQHPPHPAPAFRGAARNRGRAYSSSASVSPTLVPVRASVPAGISSACLAPRTQVEARHGRRGAYTLRTTPSRSRKTTSIGKRMKKEWTLEHGRMRSASPGGSDERPISPSARAGGYVARRQSSARRAPVRPLRILMGPHRATSARIAARHMPPPWGCNRAFLCAAAVPAPERTEQGAEDERGRDETGSCHAPINSYEGRCIVVGGGWADRNARPTGRHGGGDVGANRRTCAELRGDGTGRPHPWTEACIRTLRPRVMLSTSQSQSSSTPDGRSVGRGAGRSQVVPTSMCRPCSEASWKACIRSSTWQAISPFARCCLPDRSA